MPERPVDEYYNEIGVIASRCSQEAFDKLYRDLNQRIFGYINGWIGKRFDAQDVAQETWVNYFNRKASFDPKRGKFRNFLYMIARSRVFDYFRENRRILDLMVLLLRHPELTDIFQPSDNIPPPDMNEDGPSDDEAVLKELLIMSLECSEKPHRLLFLGFRIIKWKTDKILADLSKLTLFDLAAKLASDTCKYFSLEEEESTQLFAYIFSELKKKVIDVYVEPTYRDSGLWDRYRDALVGDTRLEDFISKNRKTPTSDWMRDIKERLKPLFRGKGFFIRNGNGATKEKGTRET